MCVFGMGYCGWQTDKLEKKRGKTEYFGLGE